MPGDLDGVPRHLRLHGLMTIRDLHVPQLIERQLLQTSDLMVRQAYRYRDPVLSSTWGVISGEALRRKRPGVPAFAAAVEGFSGVGKTEACLRCVNCYPNQVIFHDTFPRLSGPHYQVAWLSVEVPASGKMADLAYALMVEWDSCDRIQALRHNGLRRTRSATAGALSKNGGRSPSVTSWASSTSTRSRISSN